MYQAFTINKWEGEIRNPKDFKIKITYTPRIPTKRDVTHFEFIDDLYNTVQITVKGESKGAKHTLSPYLSSILYIFSN